MKTVLVIEDDPSNLVFFSTVLKRWGYKVLEAMNARDALSRFLENGQGIDLILANVTLPDRSGTAVACELYGLQPGIRVLFASGTPVHLWTERDSQNLASLPAGNFAFIAKPFTAESLRRKIDELLCGKQTRTA